MYEDRTYPYGYDQNDSQQPLQPYRQPYYRSSGQGPTYTQPGDGGANGAPPTPPEPPRQDGKKKRKAPRTVAAAAAMMLLCGAAGGGTAWWVVNDMLGNQPAQSSSTVQSAVTPSAASYTPGDGSVTGVVSNAAQSVVEITTEASVQNMPYFGQAVAQGAGSGVILSEDGYIVTNKHVIDGVSTIKVLTNDGTAYTAELIGSDDRTDLAVLKIDATGLVPATFADSDSIQVGELAVAIGNPLGELGGTVTSGIISATGREITVDGESMTLLQTSAAVNPGNSGGGLFNAEGQLVGIVNAKSSGTDIEGLAFAIPANTVREVANDLIENGYVSGRPILGISVVEVSDAYSAAMYDLDSTGVYVADVTADNGLEAGDRILSIDGVVVKSTSDISGVLKEHAVGDVLNVAVEREGREVRADVTLIEQVPERTTEPTAA